MTESELRTECERRVREKLSGALEAGAELPNTVSPIEDADYKWERETAPHHYPCPSPPSKAIERFDEDANCWVFVRNRTPVEMAEAHERYLFNKQEYERSGGTIYVAGPVTETLKFTCADGSTGTALRAGDKWRIIEANGKGAHPIGGVW